MIVITLGKVASFYTPIVFFVPSKSFSHINDHCVPQQVLSARGCWKWSSVYPLTCWSSFLFLIVIGSNHRENRDLFSKKKRAVSALPEAPIIIPSQSMTGMIFQAASLPRILEQFFLNGLDVFLILPVSSQLPQISLWCLFCFWLGFQLLPI